MARKYKSTAEADRAALKQLGKGLFSTLLIYGAFLVVAISFPESTVYTRLLFCMKLYHWFVGLFVLGVAILMSIITNSRHKETVRQALMNKDVQTAYSYRYLDKYINPDSPMLQWTRSTLPWALTVGCYVVSGSESLLVAMSLSRLSTMWTMASFNNLVETMADAFREKIEAHEAELAEEKHREETELERAIEDGGAGPSLIESLVDEL